MEKQKYSKIMSFLNISWSRLPYNSRSIGWVNSHITEQMWKAQDNSQLLPFLTDFELMENCATPNVSECTNSHNIEIFCKKVIFPGRGCFRTFFWEIVRKLNQFPYMRQVKCLLWEYHRKHYSIPMLWTLTKYLSS